MLLTDWGPGDVASHAELTETQSSGLQLGPHLFPPQT